MLHLYSMRLTLLAKLVCVIAALQSCKETPVVYPEGGYEYPKHYTDKDTTFYTYPLKQFYSRKDSFRASQDFFYYKYLHEPNLSIKPLGKDYFRLEYSGVYSHPYSIIVTGSKIVIKQPSEEYNTFVDDIYYGKRVYDDTSKSFIQYIHSDQFLLSQIFRNFPLEADPRKHWSDSILKVHPQLKDAAYCWNLINDKMSLTLKLKYDSTIIPITKKDFRHIVSVINNSGYWKMPYQIKCNSLPTDGWGFSLEANTSKQYNYVSFGSCDNENQMQVNFCKACQEIIKYAKLDKRITLLFDGNMTETTKPDSTNH